MDITILNVEVDLIACLVAVAASMVVGFIWYARSVFGNTWMKLVGLSVSDLNSKEGMGMQFGSMILMNIIAAIFLSVLVVYVGFFNDYSELMSGVVAGFVSWIFAFATLVAHYMFAKRSKKLLVLDGAHQLITMVVMGVIIALMM